MEAYLVDKFNAKTLERAAVVISMGDQNFAIQIIHACFGCFPTMVCKVHSNITAVEAIGIERCFGGVVPQHLPISLKPISEVTGVKDGYDGKKIEFLCGIDCKIFFEIFKMNIGEKLEESLAERLAALFSRQSN